jgi:hypothetical protein
LSILRKNFRVLKFFPDFGGPSCVYVYKKKVKVIPGDVFSKFAQKRQNSGGRYPCGFQGHNFAQAKVTKLQNSEMALKALEKIKTQQDSKTSRQRLCGAF